MLNAVERRKRVIWTEICKILEEQSSCYVLDWKQTLPSYCGGVREPLPHPVMC